jgi:outer membrane protein assembly factor BamD (BamD/ComL family)
MIKFSVNACVLTALSILILFSGCATTVIVSEDLSPAELIQRAQEASDRNRYNVALQYYEALLERNRNNIDLVITAEYEIAFIYYKQKKYQQARSGLNGVLEYYNTPDEVLLPQHFKRMAQIVIERIDERENTSTFLSRWL